MDDEVNLQKQSLHAKLNGDAHTIAERIEQEVRRRYWGDTRSSMDESLDEFWLPLIHRSVETVLHDLDQPNVYDRMHEEGKL